MDTLSLSIRHLKGNPGPGAYYRDFLNEGKPVTNESRKRDAKRKRARRRAAAKAKKEAEEAEKAVARQMRRMEGEREAAAMGDEPMVVLVPPVRPRTSPCLLHSLTRSRSLSECCLPGSILESGGGGRQGSATFSRRKTFAHAASLSS